MNSEDSKEPKRATMAWASATETEIEGKLKAGETVVPCEYGLCAKCGNIQVALSEFDKIIFSKCTFFDATITLKHAIKTCTAFNPRGQMSLFDMRELAILIDGKTKRKSGFNGNGGGE